MNKLTAVQILIATFLLVGTSMALAGTAVPPPPVSVPVLDSWGLIGLSVLAALLGMRNLFEKK